MSNESSTGSFVVGLLTGMMIGAIAALLMAERTGDQTRRLISDTAEDVAHQAEDTVNQARQRADEAVSDVKQRAQTIAEDAKTEAKHAEQSLRKEFHDRREAMSR